MASLTAVIACGSLVLGRTLGPEAAAVFCVVWCIGFLLLGLKAHGVFYALFPNHAPRFFEKAPEPVRIFLAAFWFLQAPLAGFSGIRPPAGLLTTQAVITGLALWQP